MFKDNPNENKNNEKEKRKKISVYTKKFQWKLYSFVYFETPFPFEHENYR